MKPIPLPQLSREQLVDEFIKVVLDQDDALLDNDISKVNRLYDKLKNIEGELKRRQGDQRVALMTLYDHANALVRVKAAKATLAIAPSAARRVLEEVRDADEADATLEAGMSLFNLDEGIYKPT